MLPSIAVFFDSLPNASIVPPTVIASMVAPSSIPKVTTSSPRVVSDPPIVTESMVPPDFTENATAFRDT